MLAEVMGAVVAGTIFGVNVIEFQADYEWLFTFVPRVSKFVEHYHSILIVTEENPAERRSTLYT